MEEKIVLSFATALQRIHAHLAHCCRSSEEKTMQMHTNPRPTCIAITDGGFARFVRDFNGNDIHIEQFVNVYF